MGPTSRTKGRRAEQEVATVYREHGFDAARVPNSGGLRQKGDVVGIPGVHCEVKRAGALRLYEALAQAEREAPPSHIPAPHSRRNRSGWFVAVLLDDFITLLELRDL